jgi:hypothetical protein
MLPQSVGQGKREIKDGWMLTGAEGKHPRGEGRDTELKNSRVYELKS